MSGRQEEDSNTQGYYGIHCQKYLLETLKDQRRVSVIRLDFAYQQTAEERFKALDDFTMLDLRFPETHFDKIAINFSLPSPSGHPNDAHAAACVIDRSSRIVTYQDAHGILMPRPMLALFNISHPDYMIINHRHIQQLAGTTDCAIFAIENVLSLLENGEPAKALPGQIYRNKQANLMRAIDRDKKSLFKLYMLGVADNDGTWRKAAFQVGHRTADLKEKMRTQIVKDFWQHDFPHMPALAVPAQQPPATLYTPVTAFKILNNGHIHGAYATRAISKGPQPKQANWAGFRNYIAEGKAPRVALTLE